MFTDDFVSIWPVLVHFTPLLGLVVAIVVLIGVSKFFDNLKFKLMLKFPKLYDAYDRLLDRLITIVVWLVLLATAIAVLFGIMGIQLF